MYTPFARSNYRQLYEGLRRGSIATANEVAVGCYDAFNLDYLSRKIVGYLFLLVQLFSHYWETYLTTGITIHIN